MNALPHMDEICRRVVAAYRKVYGDDIEAIYLYGSYARSDFDEDSDIDFAAITSPKVISSDIFNTYKNEGGYYGNIFREGKRLA